MRKNRSNSLPIWVTGIYVFLSSLGCQSPEKPEAAPPYTHLIYIMSDDHATRAVRCYGSDPIQPPNIAREPYDLQKNTDELNNFYGKEGYKALAEELKTELTRPRTLYQVTEDRG